MRMTDTLKQQCFEELDRAKAHPHLTPVDYPHELVDEFQITLRQAKAVVAEWEVKK